MTPQSEIKTTSTICKSANSKYTGRIIHGDNLFALSSLLRDKSVSGKIDLVYIDPPYATQRVFRSKSIWYQDHVELAHDSHAYEDVLSGGEYLEFLRERLILIRELMSAKGTIYLHLDEKMAFPAKIIMDEVFGESNFRNWITRRKCSSKNYTNKQFGNITDYIICYSKTNTPIWNRPFKKWDESHAIKEYPKIDKSTGRRYKLVPIYAQGVRNGETGEAWRGVMPPQGKHWFTSPDNLDKLDKEGMIYWSPSGNPRKKVYLDDSQGLAYTDLWMDFRDAHNQYVSVTGYPTEKNLDMLKMIIEASSNEGSLVMDCFAGSGTTLHAATQLNRSWIGIDSSPLSIDVCTKRIKDLTGADNELFGKTNYTIHIQQSTVQTNEFKDREATALSPGVPA